MSRPWLVALFAGAAVWTAAVIVSPALPHALAAPIYAAAAVVCHQLPERSFVLAAGPMAVCARCAGLYAGGVGGFALAFALRPIGPPRARALAAGAALPTLATLFAEWVAGWPVGNALRCAAALPLGAALAAVVGAAATAGARECDRLKT